MNRKIIKKTLLNYFVIVHGVVHEAIKHTEFG